MPAPTPLRPPALAGLRAAGPWLAPALAFALAFAIRLWWVRHFIVAPYGDQPSLEAYAANVAHGLAYGTRGAYWPPAFVFLAGLVERLCGTGHAFLAVRTANAVQGALACALAADVARRLARSAAAGLVAGLALALYGPAIYYTDTFLGATLETATLIAACDAVLAYGERPGAWRLGLAGALLGLAALTKPTELPLLVPAFVHWGLRGRRGFDLRFAGRSALAALGIALLIIAPWSWRNLRVTGSPVLIDTNGGVNFYIAHNPRATGLWMDLGDADPVLTPGGGYARPATDRLAFDAGWAWFVAHPAQDARQAAGILRRFWTEPDGDIAQYGDGLRPIEASLHVPLLDFSALRDLAVLGLVLLLPSGPRGRHFLPLLVLGYPAGLALLFFAPRFRLPLCPLLAVAAGGGLVRLWLWWRQEWALAHPPECAPEPLLRRPRDRAIGA